MMNNMLEYKTEGVAWMLGFVQNETLQMIWTVFLNFFFFF